MTKVNVGMTNVAVGHYGTSSHRVCWQNPVRIQATENDEVTIAIEFDRYYDRGTLDEIR